MNSWSDFFIADADEWRNDAWDIIRATPTLTYLILTKRPENIQNRLPHDWEAGWKNVWLGVSVESEKYTSRIEAMAGVPAAIRFVSYEPALGPVDFSPFFPSIQQVIAGGESGPDARPANPQWFRDVRDACHRNGVAFFFKQMGGTKVINGVAGGDLLDGREWKQFPEPNEREKPCLTGLWSNADKEQ